MTTTGVFVSECRVRDATSADAAACAAIYAPYVLETAISFETELPTAAEMVSRMAAAQAGHAWLVLVDHSGVLGYAYGGLLRAVPRTAGPARCASAAVQAARNACSR